LVVSPSHRNSCVRIALFGSLMNRGACLLRAHAGDPIYPPQHAAVPAVHLPARGKVLGRARRAAPQGRSEAACRGLRPRRAINDAHAATPPQAVARKDRASDEDHDGLSPAHTLPPPLAVAREDRAS
jgi:hypothetical protein